MLSEKGFDLWADGYDKSVGLSEEDGTYPFAGYKKLLNEIYNCVLSQTGRKILDIGFGTGTLTAKLYEQGCLIFGQDFSERMLAIAKEKMPCAKLYQGDFSQGLIKELKMETYDAIIATYSLHHLTNEQKISFLQELLQLLHKDGRIYIGDVAFETQLQLESCARQAGDEWDDEEFYIVADQMKQNFPNMQFEQISACAGLLTLKR